MEYTRFGSGGDKDQGFFGGLLNGIFDFFGLGDLWNSISGAGLTSAEVEQNKFNAEQAELQRQFDASEAEKARGFDAEQAQLQRDWQTQMDNTKVQRSVDDMQAAGVNPAMMMGGTGVTASTPSGAAASGPAAHGAAASGSGGARNGAASLSALMEVMFAKQRYDATKAQIGVLNAEKSVKEAEASNLRETERGTKLANDFLQDTYEDRKQAIKLSNNLSGAEYRKIYKEMDSLSADITLKMEQAHSEQERQSLMMSERILNNAKATDIVLMRPYYQRLMTAQSEKEQAAAQQLLVAAAYQQGLIDNGMIEEAVNNTQADTTAKEAEAHYKHIMELVSAGNTTELAKELGGSTSGKVDIFFSGVLNRFGSIADMVGDIK